MSDRGTDAMRTVLLPPCVCVCVYGVDRDSFCCCCVGAPAKLVRKMRNCFIVIMPAGANKLRVCVGAPQTP